MVVFGLVIGSGVVLIVVRVIVGSKPVAQAKDAKQALEREHRQRYGAKRGGMDTTSAEIAADAAQMATGSDPIRWAVGLGAMVVQGVVEEMRKPAEQRAMERRIRDANERLEAARGAVYRDVSLILVAAGVILFVAHLP